MENIYLKTGDKKTCNGCSACTLVCPKNCIHMASDSEGFLYPVIEEEKCIHCGKCKQMCSNENVATSTIPKAFAGINRSKEELVQSSSGGIFFPLARFIIEKKGIVVGATYDENLQVKHDSARTLKGCQKIMGSKYVRSDINGMYSKTKEWLENDEWVLFTGTPCQVSGLKTYLHREYPKLILCDIICHANPSPKVYQYYLSSLEKKSGKKIKEIAFRSKENGWKNQTPVITYEDNSKQFEDTYFKAFVGELINRPSCYYCPFAAQTRQSDITIGDLWGVEHFSAIPNDDTGVSLFTVNTPKAEAILQQELKDQIEIFPIDANKAYSYNHYHNVKPHKNRKKFFKKVDQKDVIALMQQYGKASMSWKRVVRKVKHLMNKG